MIQIESKNQQSETPADESDPPVRDVTIARVVKSFGIRGEIIIKSHTDFNERFNPGEFLHLNSRPPHSYEITHCKQTGDDFFRLRLKDVTSKNDSDRLVNRWAMVSDSERKELKDSFYLDEIIGFKVYGNKGKYLGLVKETSRGASCSYMEVETPRRLKKKKNGKVRKECVHIPLVDEQFLKNWDMEKQEIHLHLETFDGLFLEDAGQVISEGSQEDSLPEKTEQ